MSPTSQPKPVYQISMHLYEDRGNNSVRDYCRITFSLPYYLIASNTLNIPKISFLGKGVQKLENAKVEEGA